MPIKINEVKKVELDKPLMICGFPGTGLVGTIAASYIVEKLKMEEIAYITSDKFPPLASIHNHIPKFPARIYASKKHNMLVVISEFMIPISETADFHRHLRKFIREKNVSKVIALGSLILNGPKSQVYAIASMPKLILPLIEAKVVKPIKEGATTGVIGLMLAESRITKFPVISFLAESNSEIMDPKGAANILKILNKIFKLQIDTADLIKEAKDIQKELKKTNKTSRKLKPLDDSMFR